MVEVGLNQCLDVFVFFFLSNQPNRDINWLGNNLQVLEIMTQIKVKFKPQNHIINVTDAFVCSITALLLSKPD